MHSEFGERPCHREDLTKDRAWSASSPCVWRRGLGAWINTFHFMPAGVFDMVGINTQGRGRHRSNSAPPPFQYRSNTLSTIPNRADNLIPTVPTPDRTGAKGI